MSEPHPVICRGLARTRRRVALNGVPLLASLLVTTAAVSLQGCSGEVGTSGPTAAGTGTPGAPGLSAGGPIGNATAPATNPGGGSAAGTNPTATGAVPGVSPDADSCSVGDPSASVLRRLSRVEYQLTLKELFQLSAVPAVESVPLDSDFKGFRTLAALQSVTTEHLRAYQTESDAQVKALWADTARRTAVLGCSPDAKTCLRDFVTRFGRLAYRRALASTEVDELVALAAKGGTTTDAQFGAAISGLLSSASFLFRVEIGDQTEGTSRLSGTELASRLAFTLIGRSPSADLLTKAEHGDLDTEAGLLTAARALLADGRAREFYGAFFKQWLGYEQLRAPKVLPAGWNDALLLSMQDETDRFMSEYAWGSGANFLDALTSNHSYVSADLAKFYGLGTPAADGAITMPKGHNRENSGLLSHAAVVSAKRDGDRISHRGAWVERTFLCTDLQVPTQLLDSVSDELAGLTYQQIIERRNSDAACSGCHALIDPIGVGFSAYDEIGHYDAKFDVAQFGIAPALPGSGAFTNLGQLAGFLRNRAELVNCISSKVFLYTAGREPSTEDGCSLSQAAQHFSDGQQQFAALLEGLVTRSDFRLRRAPEADGNKTNAASGSKP